MVFLKSLLFLLINMASGFVLIQTIKLLLFYPDQEKYIFGKKMFLTPGFVYRKKRWLINKLHTLLHDFIYDCEHEQKASKISVIETRVYERIWNACRFLERIRYIPSGVVNTVRHIIALFGYELVKQFFRRFLPYMITRYNLERYIELVDEKIDVNIIKDFYLRYIHKFLLLFVLVFCFLIGLFNMIIYLIIQ